MATPFSATFMEHPPGSPMPVDSDRAVWVLTVHNSAPFCTRAGKVNWQNTDDFTDDVVLAWAPVVANGEERRPDMTDEEIVRTIHDAAVALEQAMRAAEAAGIRVEAEIRYPPIVGPDKGRRSRKVWIECAKTLYSRGDDETVGWGKADITGRADITGNVA